MAIEAESGVNLTLADGAIWSIRAGDVLAECVVSRFETVMQLSTGAPPTRKMLVAVDHRSEGSACLELYVPQRSVTRPLLLRLRSKKQSLSMMDMGLLIARDAQLRGGVLLHGALAECPAVQGTQGVLLAGPGSIGKSTASARLPSPWRSLCDDATLVVRDARGKYWAHPWPTWSRFNSVNGEPAPGGSWNVQRAVPLRAIFFLSQSVEERVSPLKPAQAVSLLVESVEQTSARLRQYMREDDLKVLSLERLANANALVRSVPVFQLQLSLTGAFWREIEAVLCSKPFNPEQMPAEAEGWKDKSCAESPFRSPTSFVVLRGVSMQPTLKEPDLLEIRPYGGRSVQRGDIVCYSLDGVQPVVVHRVVSITPAGIRTCGDNNPQEDVVLLQAADILGQVVAVWRRQRRRRVSAAWQWRVARWEARFVRLVNRWSTALLADAYRAIGQSGVLRRLTPVRLRPRVVCFRCQNQTFIKLMMGKCMIGQYHIRENRWHIRRPFRLLVDESVLPQL
jgi:hypothetical protein